MLCSTEARMNITELLNNLLGAPPAGLEWLQYLVGVGIVIFGLISVLTIIHKAFGFFDH